MYLIGNKWFVTSRRLKRYTYRHLINVFKSFVMQNKVVTKVTTFNQFFFWLKVVTLEI
jgi:hypothetical protein